MDAIVGAIVGFTVSVMVGVMVGLRVMDGEGAMVGNAVTGLLLGSLVGREVG